MRTVFRAFFVDGGCSLIILVSNRIEKHALSQTERGELRPSKLWTAKIKDCLDVVEAPHANRMIATDTSGNHFGLCSRTGDILWRSDRIGEGDSGVIVEFRTKVLRSQEVFVFATWSGVVQRLDPSSGKDIAMPTQFYSQFRDLHLTSGSQLLFVTCLVPAKSDNDPVGRTLNLLDLGTNEVREVASSTFSQRIMVSPDGEKAVFVYLVEGASGSMFDRSERWEIKDIRTGSTLCERVFEQKDMLRQKAVWSPNGRYIATAGKAGHLILSAETLETVASVEGEYAQRPAFHPSGSHICLCKNNNTKIVAMNKLDPRR